MARAYALAPTHKSNHRQEKPRQGKEANPGGAGEDCTYRLDITKISSESLRTAAADRTLGAQAGRDDAARAPAFAKLPSYPWAVLTSYKAHFGTNIRAWFRI